MPSMNFIEVDVVDQDGKITIQGNEGSFVVEGKRAEEIINRNAVNTKAVLGIRPEHVIPCDREDTYFMKGTLDVHEMLGYTATLHISTGDGVIVSCVEEDSELRPGTEMYLRLNKDHIHLFDIDTGETICN